MADPDFNCAELSRLKQAVSGYISELEGVVPRDLIQQMEKLEEKIVAVAKGQGCRVTRSEAMTRRMFFEKILAPERE